MRFSLLGPVEVRDGDTPLRLGAGRERFVLAVLLLNADRFVAASGLIDLLWAQPPPTAKAALHNVISRLRSRLRGDLIATNLGGYQLRLGEHELDLRSFRDLVGQGRQAAAEQDHRLAAARFGAALALWRGPALADVDDELAAPIRAPLHEERLAAAEAGMTAELALGSHETVLRGLPELITENPYRERLYELKMAALAGAGRRAAALATYREAHRRLGADLGLAPGPALRHLEQRILSDEEAEPPVRPRLPAPRQLPPVAAIVTGRDKLVGEISAALRRPDGPAPAVAVLVGPGGVGKTTVALAAAHETAGSFPDGHLYADLGGTRDRPADPVEVAGRFLRGCGVAGSAVPDDGDERIALYRSQLADRRMLVVLDDARDEPQVRRLLPGSAGCAVLVTSRHNLGALIGAARWTIPVLAPEAALQLLTAVVGADRIAPEPDAAAGIVDLCGQLPLAVCVAAARLAIRPEWSVAEFRRRLAEQRGRLDQLAVGDLDVRASIALSYHALDPAARELLRRLGVLAAPDWPAWVATRLVDPPHPRAMNQLVNAHLVEPLGWDPVGQGRFRLHDLVAEFARERAAAEDEPAGQQAAITRLVSAWLALATEADERLEHGMVIATGLPAPPVPPGVTAPAGTAPAGWFDSERVNLTTAVGQACALGDADLAGRLALRVAGFLAMRSYDQDRERVLAEALACAREHGCDAMLVRLLGAVFAVRAQRDRFAELPAIAADELAGARRLGDPHREFHALTHAARAARMLGRHGESASWLERALRVANRGGLTGATVSRALYSHANVLIDLGRPEQAVPVMAQALASVRDGDARTVAIYLHVYGIALMEAGRLDEAGAALRRALTTAREISDDRGTAWVELALADLDLRCGRWSKARVRLDRSLRLQERVGDEEGVAWALRSRGELALAQGRPEDAVEPLRRSLALSRRLDARLDQAKALARLELALLGANDRAAAAGCREEYRAILADLALTEDSLRLPDHVAGG